MAILECRDLSKRYGSVQALERVNLTIEPGKIVGLLGPNGSGKTTLIKMANGLLTWERGDLLIDGMAPGIETKKIVSYLPERTYLSEWMTAAQTIDFFEDFYPDFRRDRAEEMLLRLKKTTDGTYDRVLLNHGPGGEAQPSLIDTVIEVCGDILAGNTDDLPFAGFHGEPVCIAKAMTMDAASGTFCRADGREGNVVYNPARIR